MIGAGIAVLTGIGAGFGIGIATSKAAEAKTAGGCRCDQQGAAAGLCAGRGNRYLWFRCCTADGNYEIRRMKRPKKHIRISRIER